jgi:hypothetical protein
VSHDVLSPADRRAVEVAAWVTDNGYHPSRPGPGVVRLDEVEPERVAWLWEGRLPLGKVTLVEGDPDQGKSTMLLDLAARVTVGASMPDGSPGVGPASVVVMIAEDALGDTVRPRLDAAGADPARVYAWEWVADPEAEDRQRPPELPTDLDRLAGLIASVGAVLVIVDVFVAYLPDDRRTFSDHNMRRVLTPLAKMAERTGAAVAAVRHYIKSRSGNALHAGGGSIGITGAARAVLAVGFDPSDETDDPNDRAHVLAVAKLNIGRKPPSLLYRLVDAPAYGCARVEWLGTTPLSADDLLRAHESDDDRADRANREEMLAELLADGPVAVAEVEAFGKEHGWSVKVLRKSLTKLGGRSVQTGFGESKRWTWQLLTFPSRDSLSHVQGWEQEATDGQESNPDPTARRVVDAFPGAAIEAEP